MRDEENKYIRTEGGHQGSMKIRILKEDKRWSQLVRQRDGKCRKCGREPPFKLEAHHIMPRARWSTRLVLENGLTLCVWCHKFGPESAHNLGSKNFAIEIIGQIEYDHLEKLSLRLTPKAQAIKEFNQQYNERKT